MTNKTNLLLDYIEKFVNQSTDKANLQLNSTLARSEVSNSGLDEYEPTPTEVEECVNLESIQIRCCNYINYLDNKKHAQLTGLAKTFEFITNYFIMGRRKCDSVLSKGRCEKLIVSRTLSHFTPATQSSINFQLPLQL